MSASLTSEMREAGENLLQELDRRKFPAKAAFWLYSTERDDWRLVIATPQRRALGSLKSYKSLQQVISKMDTPIRLRFVRLLDTKDSLIKSLSTAVGSGPRVSGMRLSHSAIRGHFIEDAYIYRMAA